jgi:hypothetical protein
MLKSALGFSLIILIAAGLFLGWSYARFSRAMSGDVRRLVAAAARDRIVVTAEMIALVPPPARRYFIHSGVVGKAIPRLVRLRQVGRIRQSLQDKWMDFEAEEFYSTSPPAFVWRAYFPSSKLPVALGRDEYLDGKGSILMKMLAVYPLADEHGDELGPAGLMRYFNEMTWFPAAFLGRNVTIEPVDDASSGSPLRIGACPQAPSCSSMRMESSRTSVRSASTSARTAW